MNGRTSDEPVWLDIAQVKLLHAESMRLFGGLPGLRDESILESAIARPRNLWAHDRAATIFDLAAAYGFGIARNHAFVDGNKRITLLAVRVFLFLNGLHFQPDEVETVTMIEALADGTLSQSELARWIEASTKSI